MNTALAAVIVFGWLIGAVLLGRALRRRLPEEHLSGDSKDAVKLAMGLVATMSALVLGLLVSSAKGSYDTERSEVIQMAAKVAFLDRVLAAYGPEAADAREQLRGAVAAAVQQMWPGEANVSARLRKPSGKVSFIRRLVSSSSFRCRIGSARFGVRWNTVRSATSW